MLAHLLVFICLACLLTSRFMALAVSYLDVRDHEDNAIVGYSWMLCSKTSGGKKKEKKKNRAVLGLGKPITQFKGSFLLQLR